MHMPFGKYRGVPLEQVPLDYLEWLGVDCLWLPPFYPSPLRDELVQPGTLGDPIFLSADPRT